mmetsp:Transcript_48135/g.98330  ORF Transcript_48135/g.98330 Transcript_48135/m.98330 type:complete len:121 (+) Transcript_48135:483-845(+)
MLFREEWFDSEGCDEDNDLLSAWEPVSLGSFMSFKARFRKFCVPDIGQVTGMSPFDRAASNSTDDLLLVGSGREAGTPIASKAADIAAKGQDVAPAFGTADPCSGTSGSSSSIASDGSKE